VSTPASAAPPAAISRFGAFVSPEIELAYRRAHLASDTRTLLVVVAVALAATVTFIANDLLLAPRWFAPLLVLRAFNIVLGVTLLVRMKRVTSPQTWDRIVFAVALFMAVVDVAVSATRPPAWGGFLGPNVLRVLAIFVFIRLPVARQLVPTTIIALGHVALTSWLRPVDTALQITGIVTFAAATIIGVEMSRRTHRHHREQYAALRREVSLRSQLEEAMAEIRTLRGIIPICAHCKSIRNDAGEWQRLEVVLHKETHAELTHGICPTCFDRHYP